MGKRRPNIVETLRETQTQLNQQLPQETLSGEKEEKKKETVAHVCSNPKAHINCPICYENLGGRGVQKCWWRVSGTKTRISYECDACTHNWTVEKSVTHTIVKGQDITPDD